MVKTDILKFLAAKSNICLTFLPNLYQFLKKLYKFTMFKKQNKTKQ